MFRRLIGAIIVTESEKMSWDLSQMVEFDDPAYIEERLTAAIKATEAFRERYRGKIESFNANDVLELLDSMNELELQFDGPITYSRYMYAADMNQDVAKHLYDKFRNTFASKTQALAFINLELGALITKRAEIIDDPLLTEYKHYLEKIQRSIPHMLTELEEQIVIAKDKNGVRAWSMLQGDWLASRTYEIEIDGETKTLPYGEIVGLYEHANRAIRKRAHQVVYENLGKDEIIWSSALRSVFSDHLTMCKLRNWPSPLTQSYISNDVDEDTINALMNTIEKNVDVYRNYLRLKAKAMKLEKLGNWDIDAPLPNAPEKKYTWDEARTIIIDAYTDFDEEVGQWMDEMYERRHIDGQVRAGKRSGAFCATWHAGQSAYILQSYNGIMGDLFTQAHELGHAMHAYLGTRAQKPSNYKIGSCIAETGSIFGELLLAEKLLSQDVKKEEKQAILAAILDGFGGTAYQVSTRVWFESMLYEAIDKGKYLDGEKISELWLKAREKMYGDSVEWLPEMRWWWTMKLHFYMANYRYYNYPYVYAQLFVYAMYRLYKEQGKEFAPKMKALLAAGSSKSPKDLAEGIGFNVTTEEFWQKGIDQFKEFVKLFEETL
ncbi:MAG: M3 family oligoendopeptidase [Candidatus Odinarchaeota archaeon]